MRRTLITGIAAALLLASAPTAAVAADDGTTDGEDTGRLMLVLDSSGSMREPTGGDQTRIEAAKESLSAVIDDLPDTLEVGLRVFGSKDFTNAERKACQDTRRVVDLGSGNQSELKAAVDGYEPHGATPTGTALQEAGKDLGDEGRRTIVLVSDGEPTCDPDPCEVAEDLARDGVDVRIDVVGFDVDGKARNALQCIAESGNGSYYDADDAESLTQSLRALTTRADRPFDLAGQPIEGAPDATSAPDMPQGQYLDRIPVTGEVFYRIPRSVAGSTVHVGALHQGEGGTGSGIRLSLHEDTADARQCASETSHEAPIGESRPIQAASVSSWKSDPEHECNTADTLLLGVDRGAGEIGGLPIELAFYEEPPLADPSGRDLTPVADEPDWTTLEEQSPTEDIVPGSSIASAPVLEDGTFAFDINSGESQVVAVPLDWGQDVQAQVDTELGEDALDSGGIGGLEVDVIGPMRSTSEVSFYASEPEDWVTGAWGNLRFGRTGEGSLPFRTGAQSQTVNYLNRDSTSPDVKAAALPGLHYVKVTLNTTDPINLPYRLTLQRNGEAGTGAPEYAESDGLTVPTADSRLVSADGVEGTGSDEQSDAAAEDGGAGGLPLLPIALGAAGIVVLAAAGLLVLRRLSR